jgi:hypothetical protein
MEPDCGGSVDIVSTRQFAQHYLGNSRHDASPEQNKENAQGCRLLRCFENFPSVPAP